MAELTILNRYRLISDGPSFRAAIETLAERVEAEGHPGVQFYRFFLQPGTSVCQAVITYSGPEAWIGHHEIAMQWPEMRALHKVAILEEVTFLGPYTAEIQDWLAGSSLKAVIRSGFESVAGFVR
jgi:hypothetical protein